MGDLAKPPGEGVVSEQPVGCLPRAPRGHQSFPWLGVARNLPEMTLLACPSPLPCSPQDWVGSVMGRHLARAGPDRFSNSQQISYYSDFLSTRGGRGGALCWGELFQKEAWSGSGSYGQEGAGHFEPPPPGASWGVLFWGGWCHTTSPGAEGAGGPKMTNFQ